MAEEIFDAIELVVNHISAKNVYAEKALLLDVLLADNIYPLLIERKKVHLSAFSKNLLTKFLQKSVDESSDILMK